MLGSDPCQGNPCSPGVCSTDYLDNVLCNCLGTYRAGDHCKLSIIKVSPIEPLRVGSSVSITITAALPIGVSVQVTSSDPSRLTVNNLDQTIVNIPQSTSPVSVVYTVTANSPGIYRIHYELNPPSFDILKPESSIVIVESSNDQKPSYSDVLQLDEGILVPGCCGRSLLEKSLCSSELEFLSSCQWQQELGNILSTKGVVFVCSNAICLPLSIYGMAMYSNSSPSSPLQYPLISDDHPTVNLSSTECISCNQSYHHEQCHSTQSHIPFDSTDVKSFLQTSSLMTTFINQLKDIIPHWLTITTLDNKGVWSYQKSDYSASLLHHDDIKNIEECKFALSDTISDSNLLYYVLRTRVSLLVQMYFFSTVLYAPPHSTHCVVLDTCSSGKALVHAVVPDNLQPTMLTDFVMFRKIMANNGQLVFKTVTFSKEGIVKEFYNDVRYWNGTDYTTLAMPPFDMEITSILNKTFVSEQLKISCDFKGSILYNFNSLPGTVC